MTHELAAGFQDFPEEVSVPLAPPRYRLRLVPDPEPTEVDVALRELETELAAVRARGPVIAAVVADLNRAVDRLRDALRDNDLTP